VNSITAPAGLFYSTTGLIATLKTTQVKRFSIATSSQDAKSSQKKDYLRTIDGNTYKFYGENSDLTEIYSHLAPLILTLKSVQNAV